MTASRIQNYNDFCAVLIKAGFSMGSGNPSGIYSIVGFDWQQDPSFETPIRWHTGDPETDPWEWRMRVLDEGNDIAYAKVFFKKSGYITRDWYPYFLSARQRADSFHEDYADGLMSHFSKRIYEVVQSNGALPHHLIKQFGGFNREDNAQFERALIELQMKMYLTLCGRQQKISRTGEQYGWSSMVVCTTEQFFGEDVFEQSAKISRSEAIEAITNQIYTLNPDANPKKIARFIEG